MEFRPWCLSFDATMSRLATRHSGVMPLAEYRRALTTLPRRFEESERNRSPVIQRALTILMGHNSK